MVKHLAALLVTTNTASKNAGQLVQRSDPTIDFRPGLPKHAPRSVSSTIPNSAGRLSASGSASKWRKRMLHHLSRVLSRKVTLNRELKRNID
jgi:hypothetical protein